MNLFKKLSEMLSVPPRLANPPVGAVVHPTPVTTNPVTPAVPGTTLLAGDKISPFIPIPALAGGVGEPFHVPEGVLYPALDVTNIAMIPGLMLAAHNEQRLRRGRPALVDNPFLTLAAARHANFMAVHSVLAHFGIGDGYHPERIAATYVTGTPNDVTGTGENIAWNAASVTEVMSEWMGSPGHKDNILDRRYTDFGGYVVRGPRGNFWCAVFGRSVNAG